MAVDLLQKSSEMGFPQAQIFLGLLYTKGDGIPKDPVQGTEWLRRAAEQGDTAGQFYLAMQYIKGEGVPQDNVLADMWLSLAASHSWETPWRSKTSTAQFQKSAETSAGSASCKDDLGRHRQSGKDDS